MSGEAPHSSSSPSSVRRSIRSPAIKFLPTGNSVGVVLTHGPLRVGRHLLHQLDGFGQPPRRPIGLRKIAAAGEQVVSHCDRVSLWMHSLFADVECRSKVARAPKVGAVAIEGLGAGFVSIRSLLAGTLAAAR